MSKRSSKLDSSLDLDLAITARILTHKLSAWSMPPYSEFSELASSLGPTSLQEVVPPFPEDYLEKVLDSLRGGESSCTNYRSGDTTSGVCGITEITPADVEDDDKQACSLGSPGLSGFVPYSKNSESCDNLSKPNIPPSSQKASRKKTEQKYEKKNIYYKAIFRDIRRYFCEELKAHSSSRFLSENILEFLRSKIPICQVNEQEMVSILGPFLNNNKYMLEGPERNDLDHKCILDCLHNFTLTKMKRVLAYPAIKTLVNYYHAHTVVRGRSARVESHKTMKRQPQKYLDVLEKILDIANKT
ncbi:unnamed protein product [Moneuplotes crassus]|uniref:Uncharacterized protein n=1 Tax=Euplotes crassus TaxID=5936 RepID=A0AAD2CVM1_EUPCR|nr:unnamed protein product [Moneuplotes crassus]